MNEKKRSDFLEKFFGEYYDTNGHQFLCWGRAANLMMEKKTPKIFLGVEKDGKCVGEIRASFARDQENNNQPTAGFRP